MAKKVKQYRYYNEPSGTGLSTNQPTNAERSSFVSGSVFGDNFPVLQLGIQALPGTKFYLNDGVDPIIIGSTGIYELDLNEQTEISAISFDANSMKLIAENNNAYLIVDIIYDNGED
jgi:hypothetical protein